jgi:hypothetical protein
VASNVLLNSFHALQFKATFICVFKIIQSLLIKIETFIPEYKVTTKTTTDDIFKYYGAESDKLGFTNVKEENTLFHKLEMVCVRFGYQCFVENENKNP